MVTGSPAVLSYRPSTYVGGMVPIGFSAQANYIFAAFTTPPTAARKKIIDTCASAIASAVTWNKLSLFYMLAAADTGAAYINWASPGTFKLTETGTGTFTADRGYTPDGAASYLDTGWDASNNGGSVYAQSDAHIGVFLLSDSVSTASDFGTGTTNASSVRPLTCRVNGTGAHAFTGTARFPVHAVGTRRTADGATVLYGLRNGVAAGSTATNSAARSAVDFNIGRFNSTFSDRQIAAVHCGAALTAAETLGLYNAIKAYLAALAVPNI